MSVRVIFAAAVVKIRLEKTIQACTGFEPMTSAIPLQCSTNRANKPTGNWSFCCYSPQQKSLIKQKSFLFCL